MIAEADKTDATQRVPINLQVRQDSFKRQMDKQRKNAVLKYRHYALQHEPKKKVIICMSLTPKKKRQLVICARQSQIKSQIELQMKFCLKLLAVVHFMYMMLII